MSSTFFVAYSGGADSQYLLHDSINQYGKDHVIALHANHGIQASNDKWERDCLDYCHNLGVKFYSKELNLPINTSENQSREARYSFFKEIMNKLGHEDSTLLTGHHFDDQIETFFFRLFRGSGLHGLTGMSKKTSIFNINVERPLLTLKKSEIIESLKKRNITWIEDLSNQENIYDRNFIRNKALPLIESRFPNLSKNLSFTLKNLQDNQDFVQMHIQSIFNSLYIEGQHLNIRPLKNEDYSFFEKQLVIREWFYKEIGRYPDKHLLNSVMTQCIENKSHNSGKILKKEFSISQDNHCLFIHHR